MKKSMFNGAMVLCGLFVAMTTAHGAGWGSLKGRFIVDGKPADPPPLVVDKDEFCIEKKPTNQALVLGKDNSLVNAVVYLRLARRGKVDVHPDYEAELSKPAELDNSGCSFEPHITLVRVGQQLVIKNSDPVGHNTKIDILSFNQIIPANGEIPLKAAKDVALPQPVQCNIHPWMKAHLLVQGHPYMAASGDDGTFEIKNIPAGKHEFQFWHETAGYLKDLKLASGKTNRQGRADLTIADGETLDLGDLKIAARLLK